MPTISRHIVPRAGLMLAMGMLGWACQGLPEASQQHLPDSLEAYRLSQPDTMWALPASLDEVSGLSPLDSLRVAAVDDESGLLHIFDLAQGSVVESGRFGPPADYEGLAHYQQHWLVLQSNGTVYRLPQGNRLASNPTVPASKYPNALRADNDCEGLVHWPAENLFLIACKGQAWLKGQTSFRGHALYALDDQTLHLHPSPWLVIGPQFDSLHLSPAQAQAAKDFAPSGLAVHPRTGQLFILSHRGGCLVVFSAQRQLQALVPIPRTVLAQPEGICFLPDATLLIASEKDNTPGGRLVAFSPQH